MVAADQFLMDRYYIDREALGNALLHAPLVAAILLSVTIIIGGREALMPGAALRLTSVAACYSDHRLQTIPLAGLRLTATVLCLQGWRWPRSRCCCSVAPLNG